MNYSKRSARVSRLQKKKKPNTTIRGKMQAEESVLDGIQRRQLKWYGRLLRMVVFGWSWFVGGHRAKEEKKKTAIIMQEARDGSEAMAHGRLLAA